jgi:benzodiazapine receptor
MNRERARQLLVFVSVLVAIVLNGAANALPLNGQTTAEISDRFRVYVVPAGYVFAIWGVIYLGQLGFVVHSLRPSRLRDPLLRRIDLWPVAVALLNAAWIPLWHFEFFPATVVVMVALLGALIVLYRRGGFGQTARPGSGMPVADRWLVQVPFSIYLGWITVATIANVAAVAKWANAPTFGLAPETIAAVLLLIGLAAAALVLLRTSDVTYGAVIVWAYFGIVVKEAATPLVPWVAGFGVLAMLALILGTLTRRQPPQPLPAG